MCESNLELKVQSTTHLKLYKCDKYRSFEEIFTMASKRTMSTLNAQEVKKFEAIAAEWWNPNGPAKGLHSMNGVRVPFVTEGLSKMGLTKSHDKPLEGLRIVDIGCGGGILSEALARLGASVTGLDPCVPNIEVAKAHSAKDLQLMDKLTYIPLTAEEFLEQNPSASYDAVVASEVIEHVDNPQQFVDTCSKLVNDDGSLFFTTINRTTRSWLGAIVAAEYVLHLLPTGTHDWNKFITPNELSEMIEVSECNVRSVQGMFYVPGINKWTWFPDSSVNYALHAIKRR